MSDILDPRHEALVDHLFQRACFVLKCPGFVLRPLRRRSRGQGKLHMLRLGYTRLSEKQITVDLYTPRTMKPRQMDAVLRVICHELTHHLEPPKIWHRWFSRPIRVIHHPDFWKKYKAGVESMKRDELLGKFFTT